MREVAISGESITLGQLLKFAGIAGSGAEAKSLLAEGRVLVDGEPELRRGRKLRRGEQVRAEGEVVLVA
ncbi:MAG: RNA-binding S4 domain-containing protein [Solirubrobacteraceae bacterium]